MTTFNFMKKTKAATINFSEELTRFDEARNEDPTVTVDLATKHTADCEIRRRVAELHFRREDCSFAGAWQEFIERAKEQGTEESALLAISMSGVRTMIKHPGTVRP